jgi:hypothetical protein
MKTVLRAVCDAWQRGVKAFLGTAVDGGKSREFE